jgi:hypothetical protein
MQRYWQRVDQRSDQVEWHTTHSGLLQTASANPAGGMILSARLAPVTIRVELGDIQYLQGGQARTVHPTSSSILIQEPYVVVPHELTSEVGLRLVVGVMADPEGLMLDARLETIAPIDRVSLSMSVECTDGAGWTIQPQSPTPPIVGGPTTIDRWAARQMRLVGQEGPGIGLVTDLGEAGTARTEGGGRRWKLTFFDQSLEKGVILVGRWGLVFGVNQEAWLDRPTFL